MQCSRLPVVQRTYPGSRRAFSLLTISLIAHSAVIIGRGRRSIASVDFPTSAPDEMRARAFFHQVSIPPPLGNPTAERDRRPRRSRREEKKPPPRSRPHRLSFPTNVPTTEAPSTPTGDRRSRPRRRAPSPVRSVSVGSGGRNRPPRRPAGGHHYRRTGPGTDLRIARSQSRSSSAASTPNTQAFRSRAESHGRRTLRHRPKNGQVRNAEILKPGRRLQRPGLQASRNGASPPAPSTGSPWIHT